MEAKNKEVVIGQYRMDINDKQTKQTQQTFGVINWDAVVEQNNLVGQQLEIVLRVKK